MLCLQHDGEVERSGCAFKAFFSFAPASLPRARPLLVEALRKHEASGMASVKSQSMVAALAEAGPKISMRLNSGEQLLVDHIVVLFGYQPNSDGSWLAELAPTTNARGYLVVDSNMETSCRGMFAAGDVANPAHPCIATALARGAIAARQIAKRLA